MDVKRLKKIYKKSSYSLSGPDFLSVAREKHPVWYISMIYYLPICQSASDLSVTPKQILQKYKTDAQMQMMVQNMDFYVTPVLNVDGYIYSWANNTVSAHIWYIYPITFLGLITSKHRWTGRDYLLSSCQLD